jgi:putative ATP-dependent endonuclease of OLD family
MRVRHVSVKNFRGIKDLSWSLNSRLVCVIGPGDSRKSTALDAVGLALSPKWNVSLHDGDFYACDITQPIEIEVTVDDLTDDHLKENELGHWVRGVSPAGEIHDEPEADDSPAVTIRLTVDESLEPHWVLVKDAMADPRAISAKQRASLGVSELDDRSASHLKWSPGSALAALSGLADVSGMLAGAHRQARQAVFDNPTQTITDGATLAGDLSKAFGSSKMTKPRPGLDPAAASRGGGLVLHDGVVPTTQSGLGSQRLASIAFQLAAFSDRSVVLVDEVELGLEPHRLSYLLTKLRARAADGHGQVILTTHSPLVVEAVECAELSIARCTDGQVAISSLPPEIEDMKTAEPQATVRSGPSAMLASRIVVCEGKTEVGLARALVKAWHDEDPGVVALAGCVFRNGDGGQAPVKARCLASLGYPVALLVDNDLTGAEKTAYDARLGEAVAAGVELTQWPLSQAIEDQLTAELPKAALDALLGLAVEFDDTADSESAVRTAVSARLGGNVLTGLTIDQWIADSGKPESDVRAAVGRTAHIKKWFKDETKGERLGLILLDHIEALDPNESVRQAVASLKSFATGSTAVVEDTAPDAG